MLFVNQAVNASRPTWQDVVGSDRQHDTCIVSGDLDRVGNCRHINVIKKVLIVA